MRRRVRGTRALSDEDIGDDDWNKGVARDSKIAEEEKRIESNRAEHIRRGEEDRIE
jgi:hypothetical protein